MCNTIGKRLKKSRKENNLTLEKAGSFVGTTKQNLYKYENGIITNIPSDKIELLAQLYKVSAPYLMGWEEKNNKAVKKNKKGVRIPVLGKVAAGIPIEAIENIDNDEWEEITQDMASTGEYFALKIMGESMEPKFSDEDVVIVRKQEDVESREIGVVIVNGCDATVKKVIKEDNGIMLIATNQQVYPPKFYNNNDIEDLPVRIIGKVVELRAKF